MIPRRVIARPCNAPLAIGTATTLPDAMRRGLVWAPDLATGFDRVSGSRGIEDGSTWAASTATRSFDGATNRMDWPNVRNFGTAHLPHSGAMWIYPTSVAAGLAVIWTDGLGSGGPSQSVIFRREAATIEFSHAYNTTSLRHVSGNVLTVNTWHHVGWSYDGSELAAGALLYVNGVETTYGTTTNASGTARGGDGLWSLGGRVESDANCYAGRIRLPMVWDRVLAAGEFATLAAIGRPSS